MKKNYVRILSFLIALGGSMTIMAEQKVNADIIPSSTLLASPKDANKQVEKFNTVMSPASKATGTDRFAVGDAKYTKADAVDIASYQYQMTLADFQKLKAAGIKTAIVKISEGTYYVNPYARNQISLARQAGLNIAVYHYATYNNASSGLNEGRYAAKTMKSLGLGTGTLIFSDIEDSSTLSPQVKDGTNGFWQGLRESGYNNYAVYIYQYYQYRDAVVSTVGKNRTWIAQYPYSPTRNGYYEQLWRNEGYGAWQFSSTAYIAGGNYTGSIDVSRDYNGLLTGTPLSTNVGFVDAAYINGKSFHISGWHAADAAETQKNAYIIAYDSTDNREIGRVKYEPSLRQDVANSDYGYLYNAKYSGYSVDIPIPDGYQISGKNIQFIMRYSGNLNGNDNYTDSWSKNYNFDSNKGAVDKFILDKDNVLHVSGWHVADASSGFTNAYLIIYNATDGKEITRVKYNPKERIDIGQSEWYKNIYNSLNSGYDLSIALGNKNVAGKKLQVVARYSDDVNTGEGNHIDLWSQTYTMKNENKGFVDSFILDKDNVLHVSGWHAADASLTLKYAYLIIYDATDGKEITRVKYNPKERIDIGQSEWYKNIYNSLNSGYDLSITLGNKNVAGKKLQVVARYSDDVNTGEGNYIDLWSQTYAMK